LSVTLEQHAILIQQDYDTLSDWWWELNTFGWPEDLPGKPKERGPHTSKDNDNGWSVQLWIWDMIGNYKVYYRHVRAGSMTEEEFTDWYRGTWEGHKPSRERAMKRIQQKANEYEQQNNKRHESGDTQGSA
jgi:hypothetical protein